MAVGVVAIMVLLALPLLLATGSGAASRISIGTVVFSGLLASTLLSLFVVPATYLSVKRWRGVGPARPELDG